jgi:hypothetical protein
VVWLYAILADVVVFVHLLYVGFVVLGQLLILGGLLFSWQWIRNLTFRVAHLVAILIVALESIGGVECPLTVWENRLRVLAGQKPSGDTFMGQLFHNLLFYDLPPWCFTACYLTFALLVLATFLLAPPQRRSTPLSCGAASS